MSYPRCSSCLVYLPTFIWLPRKLPSFVGKQTTVAGGSFWFLRNQDTRNWHIGMRKIYRDHVTPEMFHQEFDNRGTVVGERNNGVSGIGL